MTSADPATEMAAAAAAFVAALDDDQRQVASFAFADDERLAWDSGPRPRRGLALNALAAHQRHLVLALLASALSRRGCAQALTIMSLEHELLVRERPRLPPIRDPDRYHVWLFGEPGNAPWAWRFEGHHLSLSVTITAAGIAIGPAFRGVNPARVPDGRRAGLAVLADEESAARALLASLDAGQRERALLPMPAPDDTVTGIAQRVDGLPLAGIAGAQLAAGQQHLLRALASAYAGQFRDDLATAACARMQTAGWDRLHFAWAGSDRIGEPHYFRLHGPSVLIEHANAQNRGNHIHSVWREPGRDFAAGVPT